MDLLKVVAGARAEAAQGPENKSERTDVLRFWRDVEVFNVPSPPRLGASAGRHVAIYTDQDVLPWSPHSLLAPLASAEQVWSHAVFIGVAAKSSWSRKILALACPGHKLTPSEFEQLKGEGWLAGFVVGHDGYAQPQSFVPASFALGVARLRAGKSLDGLRQAIDKAADAFMGRHGAKPAQPQPPQTVRIDDPAAELRHHAGADMQIDVGADEAPGPISFADLQQERDIALKAMGDEDTQTPYRVIVASTLRRKRLKKGPYDTKVELSFLNSFYLNDLDKLLDTAAQQGLQSPALRQYLDVAPDEATLRDVLEDTELMAEYAGPAHMLLGRWPASSHKPLMYAQQAVVGAIVSELSDGAGLMAVNGPPGTGKTTLLCDIVADVVVKRGGAIAKLAAPWRAFGAKTSAGGLPLYPLLPGIAEHTGIVVASNNNAAVENITRTLPAASKIATDEHLGAAYLPDVATHVFEVAGVDVPSWGLVAAALGNSDNRYKFSQAFFRDGRPQHNEPHQGTDLKTVLERPHTDAVAQWHAAKDAFVALEQEVLRGRDEAAQVQAALAAQTQNEASTEARQALVHKLEQELVALGDAAGSRRKTVNVQLVSLREAQTRADAASAHNAQRIEAYRAQGGVLADAAFMAAPATEQHLASLWVHPKLDLARAQLFVAALKLHEATLIACNGKSIANARAVRAMLARDTPEPILDEERASLWDFMFFCVPVVSSTLASFDRLFEGVAPASLGWLLVDEAGQATPQSVVGALWRSRRAVVIGDPMQVPPVMTAPHALVQELFKQHPIDPCFLPITASAQTLADRASRLGAYIRMPHCAPVWTGLPLRAHRRCIDPMFGVANQIAYGNQMVQANLAPGDVDCVLGPSCWFDVVGTEFEHQLVKEEMALLSDLLWQLQMDWPRTNDGHRASIFIVSPYRRVADAARALLRAADLEHADAPIDSGTVHRFQGREAEIVVLVLGSAPGAAGSGSRHWASHRPNLLNVALTRARLRLYVIGNVEDWQSCRHFEVLAQAMQNAQAIVRSSARAFAPGHS